MCGITGFNWKNENMLLEVMNFSIKHRGENDDGKFCDEKMSLGQVRLSIIDLSEKGHQPMSNEDGTIWIVFNGEIYNFEALKKKLNGQHTFKSNTDTEVLLHLYEEYGSGFLNFLNGMWAFCIYDSKKDILFLSRDRFGKKPLYYSIKDDKIIFASELKAILQHKKIDDEKTIDKEAVDLYFSLGFIPSPYTIFKEIRKLEPRQMMIYDLRTHHHELRYYYKIPQYAPNYDVEELLNTGKELMSDAVKIRMVADVPVGAYLSGGLDSSYVVSQMAKFTDLKKLNTFSVGFEGKFDETEYMQVVKDKFRTIHHHSYFERDDYEEIIEAVYTQYDEPFADFSSFPTTFISKKAKKHVSVVLTGDGGDEIFGGYPMHQVAHKMVLLKKFPKFLRKIGYYIIPPINGLSTISQLREGLRESFFPLEDYYAELGGNLVYKPEVYKKWSREKMKEVLDKCDGNLVEAVIKFDQFYGTLGDNFLTKVDRASMLYSLEARSPFLDYRFIDFSSEIPTSMKVNFFDTKILMRKILEGEVPDKIIRRGKQGFTPPLLEWLIHKDKVSDFVFMLNELFKNNIVDDNWCTYYVKVLDKKKWNKVDKHYIMRLVMLHEWFKRWYV